MREEWGGEGKYDGTKWCLKRPFFLKVFSYKITSQYD